MAHPSFRFLAVPHWRRRADQAPPTQAGFGALVVVAIIAVALVAGGAYLLLTANNPVAPAAQPVKTVAHLNVIIGAKFSGVYPNSASEQFEVAFNSNMYEGLTRLDKNNNIVGLLASSWTNPDSSTWIFNLNPKATFQNGQPVTADDVKFSIDQSIANKWPGSEQLGTVDSVSVVSPKQVKITTKGVEPVLLNYLAYVPIINKQQYLTKAPSDYAVGSGPYKLVKFQKSTNTDPDVYEVQARSDYYGAKPAVRDLTYYALASNTDRAAFILQHHIDVALLSDQSNAGTKKMSMAGYNIVPLDENQIVYMGLDVARDKTPYVQTASNPFKNLQVRQAVMLAINRQKVANSLQSTGISPASQIIPPSVFGSDPTYSMPAYNPTKAKQLLAQAGYPNGFSMTFDVPGFLETPGQEVAKELKDNLNIDATVNPLDKATGLPKLLSKDTSMFMYEWVFTDYDGGSLHDWEGPSAGTALGGYVSQPVEQIESSLTKTTSLQDRRADLQQLQKTMINDAAYIPLFYGMDLFAVRHDLNVPSIFPYDWTVK